MVLRKQQLAFWHSVFCESVSITIIKHETWTNGRVICCARMLNTHCTRITRLTRLSLVDTIMRALTFKLIMSNETIHAAIWFDMKNKFHCLDIKTGFTKVWQVSYSLFWSVVQERSSFDLFKGVFGCNLCFTAMLCIIEHDVIGWSAHILSQKLVVKLKIFW